MDALTVFAKCGSLFAGYSPVEYIVFQDVAARVRYGNHSCAQVSVLDFFFAACYTVLRMIFRLMNHDFSACHVKALEGETL